MDAPTIHPIPENGPRLQWVCVDGETCHVSVLAHLAPDARPQASCPLCGKPVILKLGPIRAHHAAHRPGDICAVTQPETALHLNAKYYLAEQLRQADRLTVIQTCAGRDLLYPAPHYEACDAIRPFILAAGWDQVAVEHPVGAYRTDVALLRGGRVLAALEVRVTHAAGDEKFAAFSVLGLAWAEIDASEDFYQGENAWTPQQPLPAVAWRVPGRNSPWKCDDCQERENKDRRRQQIEQERKARGEKIETILVRFVDFYYPSGKKWREIFRIKQRTARGRVNAIWLERDKFKTVRWMSAPRSNGRDVLERELELLMEKARRGGTVVDSPMSWHSWPDGQHTKSVMAGDTFPRRYHCQDGRWQMLPGMETLSWDGYWGDRSAYYRLLGDIRRTLNGPSQSASQRARERKDREGWKPRDELIKDERERPQDGDYGQCRFCGGQIDVWWGKLYGCYRACKEKMQN